MAQMRDGKVYLVGAGPGDPGLLTLKANECIARAEVVVYDYLANPVFLQYANEQAELIYVGMKGGAPSKSQPEKQSPPKKEIEIKKDDDDDDDDEENKRQSSSRSSISRSGIYVSVMAS